MSKKPARELVPRTHDILYSVTGCNLLSIMADARDSIRNKFPNGDVDKILMECEIIHEDDYYDGHRIFLRYSCKELENDNEYNNRMKKKKIDAENAKKRQEKDKQLYLKLKKRFEGEAE